MDGGEEEGMKNCPKCNVDFSDDFSFCEFDGATLNRVIVEKGRSALLSRLYEKRHSVQLFGIAFFIFMVAFLILAKANRRPAVVNQNQLASLEQAALYVETPQAAQEYVDEGRASDSQNGDAESPSESQTDKQRDKNRAPEKPGVEVFLPDAKPAKGSQQPTVAKSKPVEKTEPAEPRSKPDNRPIRTEPPTRQSPTISQPPAVQPQPSRSSRPQISTNRQLEDEEPPIQRANRSVNLNLVRLRSYRTDRGVRYDLTFHMQQQDGRLIRWERLNLLTRSSSGITRSEVIPFYQRLGSSGSLNFTVSVEMPGRAEADFQGRITCTGTGTDVEGRSVKTDFTARVHP
jgi:hypothetical protein